MTNKNCGIYKITNTVTGKFYIGSAVNIKQRWSVHRCQLSANTHRNRHLQNSWNKHGEDSFTFEVLEYCEKKRLIEREQFYIDNEKPAYNILPTAGNRLGVKHTDETKRKISKAKKGKVRSDETKRKMSEAMKGNQYSLGVKHTDETKRKISEAMKGKRLGVKHTDEAKRKMSKARMGNQYSLGVKHTDETKRKMSEAKMGEKNAFYGKHHTDETKRKISEAMKGEKNAFYGKHRTDETKRKISEAMKRVWVERLSNE